MRNNNHKNFFGQFEEIDANDFIDLGNPQAPLAAPASLAPVSGNTRALPSLESLATIEIQDMSTGARATSSGATEIQTQYVRPFVTAGDLPNQRADYRPPRHRGRSDG